MHRTTIARRREKVGLEKDEPMDELAFDIACDMRKAYKTARRLHNLLVKLKKTGINSLDDLTTLKLAFDRLGVGTPAELMEL